MKTTIPKIKTEKIIRETYEVQCPYCKTYFSGGYHKSTIVHKCSMCSKNFKIEWDNALVVSHF